MIRYQEILFIYFYFIYLKYLHTVFNKFPNLNKQILRYLYLRRFHLRKDEAHPYF